MNLFRSTHTPGLLAAGTLIGASLLGAEKPNIVVIFADDLGASEIGVYGSTTNHTPNLDRLALSGVHFATAYTPAVCHPSRYALLTGQYAHNHGVFHFANRAGGPQVAHQGADNIARHVTFNRLLQANGYATALAGKWQMSGKLPDLVREVGFDEYCMWAYDENLPEGVVHTGGRESGSESRTSRTWHPAIIENGSYRPTTADDYGPDIFADFLIEFARRQQEAGRPYLLYYPMVLTHAPYYPTPDSIRSPADKFRAGRENWPAQVAYADKLVGRLVSALEGLGSARRTLIIFASDNGTFGRGKAAATEAGSRIPLILYGPDIVPAAGRLEALADITDIFPTICEITGVSPPAGLHLDGQSLLPALGLRSGPMREWVYAPLGGRRVIRTPRWLLEDNTPWKFGRLYDCGTDRDGKAYREVTGSTDPEVAAAGRWLRQLMADLPVPDVTREDPRILPRDLPFHPPATERRELNSPVIMPLASVGAEKPLDIPAENLAGLGWLAQPASLIAYPPLDATPGAPWYLICPDAQTSIREHLRDTRALVRALNARGSHVFVLCHTPANQPGESAERLIRAAARQLRGLAQIAINRPDRVGLVSLGQSTASAGTTYASLAEGDTDPRQNGNEFDFAILEESPSRHPAGLPEASTRILRVQAPAHARPPSLEPPAWTDRAASWAEQR